jgi:hypothetical protein
LLKRLCNFVLTFFDHIRQQLLAQQRQPGQLHPTTDYFRFTFIPVADWRKLLCALFCRNYIVSRPWTVFAVLELPFTPERPTLIGTIVLLLIFIKRQH